MSEEYSRKKTLRFSLVLIIVLYFIYSQNYYLFFYQVTPAVIKSIRNQYQASGTGIKIAVIDSGIDKNHPELREKILDGYNFVENSLDTSDSMGHGTWVAGIIAAEDNHYGICGVAPSSSIIPLVVLDNQGIGDIDAVCRAIDWCVQEKVDLINISLATKQNDTQLHEAVNRALDAGIIIVASYSNDKTALQCYPAEYDGVIAVKSHSSNKIFAEDAVWYAPGQAVPTTNKGGGYIKVDGNSMAAAYVTGYIAVLMDMSNSNGIDFKREIGVFESQ